MSLTKPHKRPSSYFNLGWNDAKAGTGPIRPELGPTKFSKAVLDAFHWSDAQQEWYCQGYRAYSQHPSRRITV